MTARLPSGARAVTLATAFCLALFLLLAPGCSDRDELAGKYETDATHDGSALTLILDSDGDGEWRAHDQSASFTWEASAREIRLHTKDGGMVVGKRLDGAIVIELPGVGEFTFTKVTNLH